jgi:hypothetical protein
MARRYRECRSGRPHVVFGLLLVAWGGLALLDSVGLVESRSVLRTFWPVALIVWGATAIGFGRHGRRWGGLLAVVLGTTLLGNQLAWWSVRWSMLWPLVLIAVGIRIMIRRPRWGRYGSEPGAEGETVPPPANPSIAETPPDTHQGALLREFALFGGIERRNISQAFQGGEATAVFGGVQLDLRDCRMAGNEAHIEILAALGGVSLTIPRDWAVDSQISAILGGVDDRSTPPVDGAVKRLVLTGNAILGGVEVKN